MFEEILISVVSLGILGIIAAAFKCMTRLSVLCNQFANLSDDFKDLTTKMNEVVSIQERVARLERWKVLTEIKRGEQHHNDEDA